MVNILGLSDSWVPSETNGIRCKLGEVFGLDVVIGPGDFEYTMIPK